jgi:DNA repair exonuclease SbcCD ATPase subunit
MSYSAIIHRLPQDIQFPMLELVEVMQQDMRTQYAVRHEDYDDLRAAVLELTQAQARTEARLEELAQAQARTEARLEELAQARTEARLEELAQAQARTEARLEELAQAQARTEARLEELAQAQARTEQRVEELAQAQARTEAILQKLVIRVAKNTGKLLELDYRDKAYAYFGTLLRKVKVLSLQELEPQLEKALSEAEFNALLPLDLLVTGQIRRADAAPEIIYLAVEVSSVVDENDVVRARHLAGLLRKAGFPTVASVAGEDVTDLALAAAQDYAVLLMQNGSRQNWEAALVRARQP